MGLLKACLLGEFCAGDEPIFDPADQFEAKELVKVLKVHNQSVRPPYH